MTSPVVSVIMATYNHAPYVAKAIASVLEQRGVDFEFLIADDGSVDSTVQVVSAIQDTRIRFFPHRDNRGAGIVINELIAKASGEFIALINSDDCWSGSDKLAIQLNIMQGNPALGACFGRARFVSKSGGALSGRGLPFGTVFEQGNRSQGAWLRYFFESGNCICHPTMLIRSQCYRELGSYKNNLRQLPDFDMWIRLVKRYPIHITERVLVDFRVLPGENASSQTVANSVRVMNEHYLIAESFFDDVSAQQLKEGFSDLLRYPELPSEIHVDIEKVLLMFVPHKGLGRAYSMIGLLKLNRLLASTAYERVLAKDYGIDGRWFQERTAEINVLRPRLLAMLSQQKHKTTNLLKRILAFLN
ncbi:glycosyltransferase [Metapseudomonas otitidis]|uniref:glycosyltransferase n=1 Tax=Metapseudomonas otitidis TaxID=319939 RepID=UPI0008E8A060|nr:glycosyltransferase [Pseudomonas otitidis]SFA65244.1 Glycosyl transferase family 2 [Pseudomonas otitidis]